MKPSALRIKKSGKLKGGDVNMSKPGVPFTNSAPDGAKGSRLSAAKKLLTK